MKIFLKFSRQFFHAHTSATVIVRLLLFVLPVSGFAQLISPGPLMKSHAHLEGIKNCTTCHSSGNAVSDQLCMDCHKTIKNEWETKKSYHGWIRSNENKNCVKCHSDHNGETFNPIRWIEGSKEKFDHTKTGYPLTGSHLKESCESCHQPINHDPNKLKKDTSIKSSTTFLALSNTCQSCHFDEHRGTLGTDCASCHKTDKWKNAELFSHSKTQFALTGKHEAVDCIKCHQPIDDPKSFRGKSDPDYLKMKGQTFRNCSSCHNNPHPPTMSNDCKSCHVTQSWSQIKQGTGFNHDQTGYPLTGQHKLLDCKSCHFSNVKETKSNISRLVISNFLKKKMDFSTCQSCHADEHNGQFKKNGIIKSCESCHTTERFRPSLFTEVNHGKTDFPLIGAHLSISCTDCHKKSNSKEWIFHPLKTECLTCHTDIHHGEANSWMKKSVNNIPQCESCHQMSDWKSVKFDHDLTSFSLTEAHSKFACIDCHKPTENVKSEKTILFKATTSSTCEGCHQDIHEGQFIQSTGKINCERCHTAVSWTATIFDHERDSRFKLDGAHIKVECASCHKIESGKKFKQVVRFKPLPGTCESCHG